MVSSGVGAHGSAEDGAELLVQALVLGVREQAHLAASGHCVEHVGRVLEVLELLELLLEVLADGGALLFDLLAQRVGLRAGGGGLLVDRRLGRELDVFLAAREVGFLSLEQLLDERVQGLDVTRCDDLVRGYNGVALELDARALERADGLGQRVGHLLRSLDQTVGGSEALLFHRNELELTALFELLDGLVALGLDGRKHVRPFLLAAGRLLLHLLTQVLEGARLPASSTCVMMYCAK